MIIDFLKDNRGPAAYRLPPDENPILRTQFSVQANDEQIDEKHSAVLQWSRKTLRFERKRTAMRIVNLDYLGRSLRIGRPAP